MDKGFSKSFAQAPGKGKGNFFGKLWKLLTSSFGLQYNEQSHKERDAMKERCMEDGKNLSAKKTAKTKRARISQKNENGKRKKSIT